MQLTDSNWMDVERYLERDNRIILLTGSTEQHAYLRLTTDIMIPTRIADAAAKREKVLVAPPFYFGVGSYFAEFPGTISLSQETFAAVLTEMVKSLSHQGFSRFFIINGHGGNKFPSALQDLNLESTLQVVWYDWWLGPSAKSFEQKHNLFIGHGNWGENFPFTRIAHISKTAKPPVNLEYLNAGESPRSLLGDGSYGGPYQVDDKLMNELFDLVVEEVVSMLQQFRN